jgi:mono/diheme cytochrome c family protein
VLGVGLFIAFWVILGIGVFFVAARGGLGGARATLQTQTRGGRTTMAVIFVIIYIGFGVLLPIGFLVGNDSKASGQISGIKLTTEQKQGRELFGQKCGFCHTLAAANTIGKVGPNLDTLQPPYSLVLHTIQNGCLQNPPSPSSPQTCLGQGTMPANVVQGKDAENVAQFVAKVAGKG